MTSITKLDATTRRQLALVDAITVSHADTLDALKASTLAVKTAGDAATAANEAKAETRPTVWGLSLTLAEAVCTDETAADMDAVQRSDVFSVILQGSLSAEALKTMKAYLSTGKSVIAAVTGGKYQWHQFKSKLVSRGDEFADVAVTYDEVRDMLKSSGQKELDALYSAIVKTLSKVRGKEKDVRGVDERRKALESIKDSIEPLRLRAVRASDEARKKSKAATAIADLVQHQPQTSGVVESVAEAAGEVKAA